jgi:hypothetical protein
VARGQISSFPGVFTVTVLLIVFAAGWPWFVLHGVAKWITGICWSLFVVGPIIGARIAIWWRSAVPPQPVSTPRPRPVQISPYEKARNAWITGGELPDLLDMIDRVEPGQ